MRDIIAGKSYHQNSGSDTESRLSDIELKISSSDDDDASRKSPDVKLIKNECTIIDISDSSNDTSSRGTFDLIIPPPIDFQGNCFKKTDVAVDSSTPTSSILKESPSSPLKQKEDIFVISEIVISPQTVEIPSTSSAQIWRFKTTPTEQNSEILKSAVQETESSTSSYGVSESSIASSYLPSNSTPAAPPLYRLVNRQLSASDIIIGPNNEIKRRKISRKRMSLVSFIQLLQMYKSN